MAQGAIRIGTPVVERKNGLCRLNCDINENGDLHRVFVEVEEEYGPYLTTDRADGLLYLTLPLAMRLGYDIYCEVPVTEQFLHNLTEILIPHLVIGDASLFPSKIYAPTTTETFSGTAVGTGVSCGVDSLYTIMEHTVNNKFPSMRLTHLLITSGSTELWDAPDLNLRAWVREHGPSFDRFETVSRELNLPLVKMYSNFLEYSCESRKHEHLFIHHYVTMAMVLQLKKMWKAYFFASAMDFTFFNLAENATKETDAHELLSIHVLGMPDFFCFSGGAKTNRVEKTRALADWDLARRTLHPCHGRGATNCSNPNCQKCLRALFVLDYYEKLDNMKAVFDVDRYRAHRVQYLVRLDRLRENSFMAPLYEMMLEKYPEQMERAKRHNERVTGPVPRAELNEFKRWYAFHLELLSFDDHQELVRNFFRDNGVKTLYCSGHSLLGDKIGEIVAASDDISCVTHLDATVSDADAAFIRWARQSEIQSTTTRLEALGAKRIFMLADLHTHFIEFKRKQKIEEKKAEMAARAAEAELPGD